MAMTRSDVASSFARWLSVAILCTPVLAAAGDARVQFCWAMGKFDNTVYFAEVEDREDRQASFDQLLEISGIDHYPVQCRVSEAPSHYMTRARQSEEWRASELEIVNTTFLSDLDY